MIAETPKKLTGFATQNKEQHKAASALGGREAHARKRANRFTSESGRAAGLKGGKVTATKYGKGYMKEIGQKGGIVSSYENPEDFLAK